MKEATLIQYLEIKKKGILKLYITSRAYCGEDYFIIINDNENEIIINKYFLGLLC